MKKTILIAGLFTSTLLFSESEVMIELPTDPCALIADAECSIGSNGEVIIEPYNICDTHDICEIPERPIDNDASLVVDADEKFLRKQAKIENNILAKYAKLEIYKECAENAINLKGLKGCKKDFKRKTKKNKKSKVRK